MPSNRGYLSTGLAKSDILDLCDSPGPTDTGKMVREVDEKLLEKSTDTTIHSGHFMVSCVHRDDDDEESETEPKVKNEQESKTGGYNFDTAPKEPSTTYKFGDYDNHDPGVCIDCSLTKLFNCMTLAYRFVYCVLCCCLYKTLGFFSLKTRY